MAGGEGRKSEEGWLMAAELGHRERVLRAIEHREVDRPPCFWVRVGVWRLFHFGL